VGGQAVHLPALAASGGIYRRACPALHGPVPALGLFVGGGGRQNRLPIQAEGVLVLLARVARTVFGLAV
jgi:hypothetical protein